MYDTKITFYLQTLHQNFTILSLKYMYVMFKVMDVNT